jgi:fibro-slime domain-containing protein
MPMSGKTWTVPIPPAIPGLTPRDLYSGGPSVACDDNPCDPYCTRFEDVPDGGITSAGAVVQAVCGDGIITYPTEACDDANTVSGDGCNANCTAIEFGWLCPTPGVACVNTVICGDGAVLGGETCDDGNTTYFDGCSGTCTLEPGWICPVAGVACLAAQCGDGYRVGAEACDDHNAVNGDGCSSTCQLEPGFKCPTVGQACVPITCGDGIAEGTEQCDDGNMNMGDGCTPFCEREPICGTNGDANSCAGSGSCNSACGDGITFGAEQCDDGNTASGDGCSSSCTLEVGFGCTSSTTTPPASIKLPIVLRDFRTAAIASGGNAGPRHPDFEASVTYGVFTGLVQSCLSADQKPVYYRAGTGTPEANSPDNSIHGTTGFDQWYRDNATVNRTFLQTLTLGSIATGKYQFYSSSYFPLDALGFGKQGLAHNFGFTSEVRYWFKYAGGEVFNFCGDDDVWVFVNKKLALDIGGVHAEQCRTLTLDATIAASHNLVVDKLYEIVVWQAERHTTQSNYKLTLTGFQGGKSTCATVCGDGVVTPDEQCDNGTANNTGGYGKCKANCTLDRYCGDSTLDPEEDCDDGVNLSTYGNCAPGCVMAPRCGDGVIDPGFGEQCDDGVNDGSSACHPGCLLAYTPFVATRVFQTSCAPGTAPRWLAFGWDSTTPNGTRIDFRIRSFSPNAAGTCDALAVDSSLDAADVDATAALTPDTQACLLEAPPVSSTCPLDLLPVLGEPGVWLRCLQMDAYGYPSTPAYSAPTLLEWTALYDCMPSE